MRHTVCPLALALACGATDPNGTPGPNPATALDPGVPPITTGRWDRPSLSVTWQWQINGPVNTAYDVDLYDVDLFDVSDSVIATLHQAGRTVLCYFSAGSGENWRADFNRIPAGALGKPLDGWPGERWLDIRAPEVFALMQERLDRAVARGCDGVEPDNMDASENDSGFDLTAADQLAFNRNLANEAHRRDLTVALRNAGTRASDLVDYFDLELNEECHAFDECDVLSVFPARTKPVLNVEYVPDAAAAQTLATTVCPRAATEGFRTLILPLDLDDRFRLACP